MMPSLVKSAPGVEHEQRQLECTLTPEEKQVRAKEQADTELEIRALKAERGGLTGAINKLGVKRGQLADVVKSERETRMVACTWTPDFTAGTTSCSRDDTGEVIESRPLTAAQRQGSLALVEGDGDDEPEPESPKPLRGRRTQHEHA
jgi:hypothetical protein